MSKILDRWEHFKEIKGAEYALTELEKVLGTWLLEDNVRYILRVNDYDGFVKAAAGGELR